MKCAIKYFSFWDVPRTFAFERNGNVYLLTSEFNGNLDEYPDEYEVFRVLDVKGISEIEGWESVEPLPKLSLGKVPVKSVNFDESQREFVDDGFLTQVPKLTSTS